MKYQLNLKNPKTGKAYKNGSRRTEIEAANINEAVAKYQEWLWDNGYYFQKSFELSHIINETNQDKPKQVVSLY